MGDLRSKVIRLAATMPAGSNRIALLDVLAGDDIYGKGYQRKAIKDLERLAKAAGLRVKSNGPDAWNTSIQGSNGLVVRVSLSQTSYPTRPAIEARIMVIQPNEGQDITTPNITGKLHGDWKAAVRTMRGAETFGPALFKSIRKWVG